MRNPFKKIISHLSYTQMIALSFLMIILLGTALLCLPVSSRSGQPTPFLDSLFTATSATCVTGLSVYDTCMHWSVFGQAVILLMIQTGGLGFMTVITMFFFFFKKHISLRERRLLMQSSGDISPGGVVKLIRRILLGTLMFEGVGIVLLSFYFCPRLGFFKGVWFSVFHSVSAYCNAGFDLMSALGSDSFTGCDGNVFVNLTLIFLIIIGGIGFIVWNDVLSHKYHFRRYELHSKIALTVTAALLVLGTALYYVFEQKHTLSGMSEGKQWLVSLFQAVTPRTAGFYTVDMTKLSESGNLLTIVLMFIGGSPGSCAGGIKTTTFAVICAASIRCIRKDSVVFFRRKIVDDTVKQASAIGCIYLFAVMLATTVICALESSGLRQTLFEVVSAIGTVGLTAGLTAQVGAASKLILILLMYAGRIGGMTLVIALAAKKDKIPLNRPPEKILIG